MLVFGYGTLRNDYHPKGGKLRFVGPATMKGELWVIDGGPSYGTWAGVAPGSDEVFGHLFEGPEEMLKSLDYRERCQYGNPAGSVYHRELVEVEIAGSIIGDVWVYIIAGVADPLERVESGDWDDRPEWLGSLGQIDRELSTVRCDICGRGIKRQTAPALCSPCEGTGRAHAKLERNHREWTEDGSP